MAFLKQAKTEEEIKKLTVANVKKAYNELASDYNKLIEQNYIICPICGEPISRNNYYTDKRYAIGVYPECKKCILAEVEQRKSKNDKPNETKESVQKMLQKMDLPYIDSLYESLCVDVGNEINEKNKTSPFLAYLPPIKSLPQYKDKTWKNSEFGKDGDETKDVLESISNRKPRKEIIKLFGSGMSTSDYLYLQDQYDDWVSRTQVDSKSQETYIVRICFKLLDIWKAQKEGKDTSKLDDSLNKLMEAAQLQPKQNVGNAATDSLTFGQLIEKWEMEKPIPEPAPEFKDVDGISQYIRIWFSGWLSKAVGLNNTYSQEFDEYMKKYTVTKPECADEENSEDIYDKLFGKDGE